MRDERHVSRMTIRFYLYRVEKPLMCMQCNAARSDKIVIANEPIFIEGEFRGLEGIVRFCRVRAPRLGSHRRSGQCGVHARGAR
jgi:hypothetical protein